MPVIRITDVTWDRLKRWAIPLEDSPEDAVRKVLDAAEEHLKCPQSKLHRIEVVKKTKVDNLSKRIARGVKVNQKEYRRPILETINTLGGSAPVGTVLKSVEEKMKSRLTEIDYEKIPSGGSVRWVNTAEWARFELVKRGLLEPSSNSPWGVWILTAKGREELKKTES